MITKTMGMFDSVLVPCPKCGKKQEFQSKSGDCTLKEYDLHECPEDVLEDVNRHAPYKCKECGTCFEVEFEYNVTAKSVVVNDN